MQTNKAHKRMWNLIRPRRASLVLLTEENYWELAQGDHTKPNQSDLGRHNPGQTGFIFEKQDLGKLEASIFKATGFRWTRNWTSPIDTSEGHRIICRQSVYADRNKSEQVCIRDFQRRKQEDREGPGIKSVIQ